MQHDVRRQDFLERGLEGLNQLHVVDGSDPFPIKQIEAVNKVIYDIVKETGETLPEIKDFDPLR